MSLFKKYLSDSETLFKNETALDPNFTPKKIQFRESENEYIVTCIKPLFQNRYGKNLIIYGPPGIGKTLACIKIKEELEETTDDILVFYINLWKKNTQYKIILELCAQLDYKFIQNKSADELFQIIKSKINQKSTVFILDEIDKADSLEILYSLMEDIYKKTLILITNDKNFIYKLDPRLKSRLLTDNLEFKPYSQIEIQKILKNRIELAFHVGVFPNNNLNIVTTKTYESADIRKGLFLLRESGLIAESQSLKQISSKHIEEALAKLETSNKPLNLDIDEKKIFKIISSNPDRTTQEIFNLYQKEGNKSERTFQRKLKTLEKANLIELESMNIQGRHYKIKLRNSKSKDF